MNRTVFKTAVSQLRESKSRSLLTAAAIFLTSTLLMALASGCFGIYRYERENAGASFGDYQAGFKNVTEEGYQKVLHNVETQACGKMGIVFDVQTNLADAKGMWIDKTAQDMLGVELTEGRMPEAENEIVLPLSFLKALGLEGKTGSDIRLSYRLEGKGKTLMKTFRITGLLKSTTYQDLAGAYALYVSEAFMRASVTEPVYMIPVKVYGEKKLDYYQMQEKIEVLAQDAGLTQDDVFLNKGYLMSRANIPYEIWIVLALGAGVIMLFSVLVIYNIIYVGVIQRVQEYGKLRLAGMTGKQMKGMLWMESCVLTCGSLPFGILAGWLTAKGLVGYIFRQAALVNGESVPEFKLWSFPFVLLIIVLTFLTVFLAIRKPMRIAAAVSPMEAVRFQEPAAPARAPHKLPDQVTVMTLVRANFAQNRKRTAMTVFTMGLSCVLFIVAAVLFNAMDPADDTRQYYFPDGGDFRLELDYGLEDETYPENNLNLLQERQLLGDAVIEEIKDIDGVTGVIPRREVMVQIHSPYFTEEKNSIEILDRQQFETMRQEYLISGDMDYEECSQAEGLIFSRSYDWKNTGLSLGSRVPVTLWTGSGTIPVTGAVMAVTRANRSWFCITEDTLAKWTGGQGGGKFNTALSISCDPEKKEGVKKALESFQLRDIHYKLQSYDTQYEITAKSIQIMKVPVYCAMILIGIIGFLNLLNTTMTGYLTRKQEFGMLQAVGLSARQLIFLVQTEGLLLTAGSLLLSLTLGNGLGYLLFLQAKKAELMGFSAYHYPWAETLCLTAALLLAQGLVSLVMAGNIRRESVIDRIRYTG